MADTALQAIWQHITVVLSEGFWQPGLLTTGPPDGPVGQHSAQDTTIGQQQCALSGCYLIDASRFFLNSPISNEYHQTSTNALKA